jgi:hypothetical protein
MRNGSRTATGGRGSHRGLLWSLITVVAVLAAAVAGCSGDEAVTVPDLVGVEVADAEEALSAAELELGDVDYELVAASSKRLDTVLSQAPSPGTEVDVGAAVALVVAKGPGETAEESGSCASWRVERGDWVGWRIRIGDGPGDETRAGVETGAGDRFTLEDGD